MDADLILAGAGLAGAAFLAHLLRDHPALVGRIAVLEPAAHLGAGLAYGSTDPAHRTNVAAGRMSLFPDRPNHFLEWLGADGPVDDPAARGADGLLHVRRGLYGRYADETTRAAIAASAVQVRHHRQEAVAASRRADGGWRVALADGGTLDGRMLVLAVGHSRPELPAALRGIAGDPRLVADPWQEAALASTGPRDTVLVVGTGLTACDVVASLRLRGHRGRILAVSRRGLLPRPRTHRPVGEWGDFTHAPEPTALALLRRVRRAVGEAAALDRPWEDVVAALRVQAATVWGALPVEERRRLLRHLRPFWDVHRFQCAPQIDAVLRDGRAGGWLCVRAGRPVSARAIAAGIAVRIATRGGGEEEMVVDRVVCCTGPGHRSVVEVHPLLRSLALGGWLRADPCRLGIDVDGDNRVLDAAGRPVECLRVAGPLARGTHGELMGLPQVATQPRAVATGAARFMMRGQGVLGQASVPP